jgi:CheY-like chemotaxis protein
MRNHDPILLIDDDRVWLDTLTDYLEGKGFQVRTAEGGVRGLEAIERGHESVVVMDFHMHGLNGLDLLRHLRRLQRSISVFLVSSDDDPFLPARALAEGARAFLPKSEAPRELLHLLRQAFQVYVTGLPALLPAPPERRLPVPLWLFERKAG